MSLEIIYLDQIEVDGGRADDPARVKKMVGDRPNTLGDDGLRRECFFHIDFWEEGIYKRDLAVAHFMDEEFSNLADARIRLEPRPIGNFPELMSPLVWDNLQIFWKLGIRYVVAPAVVAIWTAVGIRCIPIVSCDPNNRILQVRPDRFNFCDCYGFLLSSPAGEIGS